MASSWEILKSQDSDITGDRQITGWCHCTGDRQTTDRQITGWRHFTGDRETTAWRHCTGDRQIAGWRYFTGDRQITGLVIYWTIDKSQD